jgi:hypothetical protein
VAQPHLINFANCVTRWPLSVTIEFNWFFSVSHQSHFFSSSGVKPEEIVRVKQALHDERNYSKLDFKTHISINSKIADHCSTFELSDSYNSAWEQKCQNEHDEECVHVGCSLSLSVLILFFF